jgi:hypothetical protein
VDRQNATDVLVNWLTPLLGEAGFERADGGEYFIRLIPGGRQAIGMAVWDYNPLVEVALLVTVRLRAVEEVFHLFTGADLEHQGFSSTIITPFYYCAGGPERVKAQRVEDLFSVFGTWEEPLHAEVLPYLDLAKDVVSLDRLLNVTHDILDRCCFA